MLRLSGARRGTVVLGVAVAVAAAGCAGGAGTGDDGADRPATVTLVTHDSWALDDSLVEQFEQESGHTLEVSAAGDAGTLVNQLVLTKDAPLGDAVFGIDRSEEHTSELQSREN